MDNLNIQKYLKYKSKNKIIMDILQMGGVTVLLNNSKFVGVDNPEYNEICDHVISALKRTLGFEDVRSFIISKMATDAGIISDIFPEIKTFDAFRSGNRLINNYCKMIIATRPKYAIFTACNLADRETGETHYMCFLVDSFNGVLYAIDPAIVAKADRSFEYGMYTPFIAEHIMKIFNKAGYRCTYVNITNPAQSETYSEFSDHYCQTWSLYILLEFMKSGFAGVVDIPVSNTPKKEEKKYKILLDFYKELITWPFIKTAFLEAYGDILEEFKDDFSEKIKEIMPNLNAIDFVTNMTVDDLLS